MPYSLGVDLGTTYTAAAVMRDGRAEIVPLGNHAATIPTAVFLRDDDTFLIGDAAERRGVLEPTRLAREFKRRLGDPSPVLLGGSPLSAERLLAVVLGEVIAQVTQRQGAPPDAVAISHPANWGDFKLELLRQAVQLADLRRATFLTEPIAAAVQYAACERVDSGSVIAVYDLGGGTFDAAVLRKSATGFEPLGRPEGIERLGGIDFDEAVMAHVRRVIGEPLERLDPDEPTARAALSRLRHECVAAKETLSADADATVPVLLPTVQTDVRITRTEFEDMIRPVLRETVASTRRAVESSGLALDDVTAVLLAGGSSRIPLVADMVRSELGRPVVTDTHPKQAVALGAARVGSQHIAREPQVRPVAAPPLAPVGGGEPATTAQAPVRVAPAPIQVVPPPAARVAPTRQRGWFGAAAVIVAAAGGGLFLMTRDHSAATSAVTSTPLSSAPILTSAPSVVPPVTSAHSAHTSQPHTAHTEVTPPTSASTSPTVPGTDHTSHLVCGASKRCVGIDRISVSGGAYVVDYSVDGFTPTISGSSRKHHLHFFYDTVAVDQAGSPGSGPWFIWDLDMGHGAQVFDGMRLEHQTKDGGEGATRICVAVADHHHAIEADTVACAPIPAA